MTAKLEAGSCIITRAEMVEEKFTSQTTYRIMKRKGAPIIGIAVLLLDPAFRWFVHEDPDKLEVHFEWTPIE